MARGRMLPKTLPTSRKLAALSCDGARLAFCLLSTQVDDQGRMEADAVLLRYLLFPRDPDKKVEELERWLVELHNAGLIVRWWDAHKKEHFLVLVDFKLTNWIRADRSKPSLIPPPPAKLAARLNDGRALRGQPEDNQASPKGHPQFNLSQSKLKESNLKSKNHSALERIPRNRRELTREDDGTAHRRPSTSP